MLRLINIPFDDQDPVSPIQLSMSSCYGLHAILADDSMGRSPFGFVLGHENEISWDDALIAFSVYYHNFVSKKMDSQTSLKCMNESINNPGYFKLFGSSDIYSLFGKSSE